MTTQQYIYNELRAAGMTPEGACSVLGNLEGESAFITRNVEDRSGIADDQYTTAVDNGSYSRQQFIHDSYGYGLAQWTYFSRKAAMYDAAKASGVSIGDLGFQVRFLIDEMKKSFPSIWALCCSSNDLYNCTRTLLYTWENPAEKENNMRVRYANALRWFNTLNGTENNFSGKTEEVISEATARIIESWPPRTIDKKCDSWPEFMLMAWALACHGYDVKNVANVNDVFSVLTDYQKDQNLFADGICGPMTWKTLLSF